MPNSKPNPGADNKMPQIMNVLIIAMVLTFMFNFFLNNKAEQMLEIEYSQFIQFLDKGYVERVQVEEQQVSFHIAADADREDILSIIGLGPAATDTSGSARSQRQLEDLKNQARQSEDFYSGLVEDATALAARLDAHGVEYFRPVIYSNPMLDFMKAWILPLALIYIIYIFFLRNLMKRAGGGPGFGMMNNVGKSKAKLYNMEMSTGVTFSDVAGQEEAKESLVEIIDFLHNPDKYKGIGAKQPKGALLVGPPGTGKTLLAKAVAGEAKVPFYSLSGSEFVEMFVGVGASRVRDLFEQADKTAPCIIFIDEIDAIGKSRDQQFGGGNDEREQTLNQLLSEMDGFDSGKGIIVLAATNRPEILDKALLRPGRFDRRIIVEKPDLIGREAVLKVHAVKIVLNEEVDLHQIALATSGATGADLANILNEAALRAVRLGRTHVLQEDLLESVEVVIAGKEKKDRIMNAKEKRLVAYHEVGHALATALQKEGQPVQKITIVPRTMGALGYTMNMPEEERFLMTKDEIIAQITTLLAGRAAEEVQFNEVTTGASNDIERATKLARSMVTQYGMTDKFDMMGLESIQNQYLDGRAVATASEATGQAIDEEVRRIITSCHQKATELLLANREHLVAIAEFLLEKETITGVEFMNILKGENSGENFITNKS
jgi:cell division protease FtsH